MLNSLSEMVPEQIHSLWLYFTATLSRAMNYGTGMEFSRRVVRLYRTDFEETVVQNLSPWMPEIHVWAKDDEAIVGIEPTTNFNQVVGYVAAYPGISHQELPGKIHTLFLADAVKARQELTAILPAQGTVVMTGHSYGGAIAQVLRPLMPLPGREMVVHTYGCPRVGSKEFADSIAGTINVRHYGDPIPSLPPRLAFLFPGFHIADPWVNFTDWENGGLTIWIGKPQSAIGLADMIHSLEEWLPFHRMNRYVCEMWHDVGERYKGTQRRALEEFNAELDESDGFSCMPGPPPPPPRNPPPPLPGRRKGCGC